MTSPSWSPDSEQIVFESEGTSVNAGGSGRTDVVASHEPARLH